MRNARPRLWFLIAMLSTVIILPCSWAIPQDEDSIASSVVSGPALQFQILQGVGCRTCSLVANPVISASELTHTWISRMSPGTATTIIAVRASLQVP